MMVTKNFLVLKTQFDFISKRLLSKSLYGNMVGIVGSIWVIICSYFFVFGFISRYKPRFQADNLRNHNPVANKQQDDQVDSKKSRISESGDQNREEETESFDFMESETISAASTDLYEFRSGRDINGYMEEPKAMSFIVQELYVGWSNSNIYDQPKTEAADQEKTEGKAEAAVEVKTEPKAGDFTESVCVEEVLDKKVTDEDPSGIEECPLQNFSFSFGKVLVDESEISTSFGRHDPSHEAQSLVENCAGVSDSKEESVTSRKDVEFGSIRIQPQSLVVIKGDDQKVKKINMEDFQLHDIGRNVSEGLQPHSPLVIKEDDHKVKMNIEHFELHDFSIPSGKEDVFSVQSDGSDDEFIELSEPQMQNSSSLQEEVEDQNGRVESAEEIGLQEGKLGSNSDDENEGELPWEHDDIIEQLKMEIRNVGTRRLPTILEEESECTKMVENLKLKPMNIDEKLEYKDRMAEIQKVYKSYAEKMKKLDILNNQTMHAIGFVQLKDQVVKSTTVQKSSSVPIVKSLISQNLWRCKAQRQPTAHDPMPKFVGDLHKDLELVYVGQVCLSWEILNWQHGKAQELQQYDQGQGYNRQFNIVATEFQLFQVLLQRFIEDDPFQGPRVQHYVKNRCVLGNLLQVPAIRDDNSVKDKKHVTRGEEDSIILMGMLVKIIEESIYIFWNFLRKDERNSILRGPKETQVDQKDLDFLMDIRKDLQKKEKKLKDIQRRGNCVVKKFQKPQEQRLEHNLLLAQVELRLISRVLNMSKLKTEHLVWCHEKLENINCVNRKIHMEPSFLLFPC